MTVSKYDLLEALWNKHEALYDFLQDLNDRLSAGDRPDYEGVIANSELEIARIEAVYDLIDNDKPIPYPSDQQVADLASATGRLQKVTDVNAAYEKMAVAATELVKTWPVSKAG